MLNIGERQVRESLAELEAIGWIKRIEGTGHGPGNPAKYLIAFVAMLPAASEFDRSKGANLRIAKAANVGRNKPAHVGRILTEEKRRILNIKAADSEANAPHVQHEMRRTGVNEPEVTGFKSNGFEPSRTREADDNETAMHQPVDPLIIEHPKAEPERPAIKQMSQAEQIAWLQERIAKEGS